MVELKFLTKIYKGFTYFYNTLPSILSVYVNFKL